MLDDAKAKVDRATCLQAAAVGEAARGVQGQIANELELASVAEVAMTAAKPLLETRMGGTSTA